MDKEELISQLIAIYMLEETWHKNKLSLEESWKYFKNMIGKGNLVYREVDGVLTGYVEFYIVDEDQAERLLKEKDFFTLDEDIVNGNVCYISNVWIRDGYRGNGMMKSFNKEIKKSKNFSYYSGNERKNNNRIRVWEK